jgi:signal transduction histidine kinase
MILVAVVPVLVVGASARGDASAAALRASKDAVQAHARAVAEVLDWEASATATAVEIVASAATIEILSDPALLEELAALHTSGGGAPFQSLAVRAPDGQVIAESGPPPSEAVACTSLGRATLMRRVAPIRDTDFVLEGTYWLGHSLDPATRDGVAVLGIDGAVLLAPECAKSADDYRSPAAEPEDPEGARRAGPDGPLLAAVASVGSDSWAEVVAVAALPPAGPVHALSTYGLPLALIAVMVLIAHLIFRRWSDVLSDLTAGARAVSAGDLDPWLPPPGGDQLGELTLAFNDMTAQLRDRMNQVDRSGRLAVIGQLASYLAHEIRNPLSAVKMNLQRLDRWTRAGELPERCLEPIRLSLGEVDRLAASVSSVLQLSRSHDQPLELLSVHELVREAGTLLDNEFANRGVALRWSLDAEADRVLGRPGQLKGVILNLMLNALDAQPHGGALTIRSSLREGPSLVLRFRDRGAGVPSELRSRIFEPFFTTKSSGSGIGLAVAGQAVRDHGGDLRLEELRELDSGAEFVVTLPLASVGAEVVEPPFGTRLAPWMEAPGARVEPVGGAGIAER